MIIKKIPRIGKLRSGELDLITDIAGITVGHCTLEQGAIQTGVTVIKPHCLDPYSHKVPAAATVINGFGKSVGLMQLDELGVFETPIALTNTFSVSSVAQAQIKQAITLNPEIGRAWPTINPLVFECNDGYLNDIQAMSITAEHYNAAYSQADRYMQQGSIGAGRGMSCFNLKGGIGSASRLVTLNHQQHYCVGALVLANFGILSMLTLAGQALGQQLAPRLQQMTSATEKGSIIMILATDAPLDYRQLKRLSLRAGIGLSRTGSFWGHGSGDIALAFSTAYTLPHDPEQPMPATAFIHETLLDPFFQAAAESVEQAIIHALYHAQAVQGRDNHQRYSLSELYPEWLI
jgi:D-aminopeptidase